MDRIDFLRGDSILTRESQQFRDNAVKGGFQSVLSSYTAASLGFFIHGCAVSEVTDSGNVTVSIAAGHVSFDGEPFVVEAGSIVRTVTEVAWLEVKQEAQDSTPTNNSEGVGRSVQIKRTMALQKGDNYPAANAHMKLDAKTQLDLLVEKLSGRLMRIGYRFEYGGSIDDFDGTGLGEVGTAAEGLAICNGLNGTPDRRGLSLVGAVNVPNTGAGSIPAGVKAGVNYSPGDVFGADEVTLTEAQLAEHNHSYDKTTISSTGGSGTIEDGTGRTVNITATDSSNTGAGEAHENRQASVAVLWVQVVS